MNSSKLFRWSSLLLVVFVLVTSCQPPTPAPPPVVPSRTASNSPFGINGGLGIRYSDQTTRNQALQLLQDAGVHWQREEFIWDVLENPKGTFHWDRTDQAVTGQRDAGIHLLGLIDYGAPWWGNRAAPDYDKDVPSPPSPEMIGEWQFYVREVVRRYRDSIHHWEIWNEENIQNFWKPVPNPNDYAQLLRAAHEVIKAEDPQAIVVMGGTSGVDTGFIDAVIAASGGVNYFDVVAIHPYVADGTLWSSPERRDLRGLIEQAVKYGKPIWLTEIGWGTGPESGVTETVQARYLVRAYLVSMATPQVEKVFWFQFREGDDPNDLAGNSMGMVSHDLARKKEAYYAYQAMTRALSGAQFVEKVREGSYQNSQITGDDVYEYRFVRGPETIVALWKSEGGDVKRPVEVRDITASSVRVIRQAANRLVSWTTDTLPVTNGQVTLEVNEMPVFLLFRASQPATTPAPTPTSLASPGTQGNSTATALVLDVSGSMGDSWREGIKIESAKDAALDIVTMMEQESQIGGLSHQVGVASFSSAAQLDLALTSNYGQAKSTIARLVPLERTNLGAGIQVANSALRSALPGAKRIIILLSDGMTNEGLSPAEILSGPVQDAISMGTCIYTVGFGDPGDLDENLLRQIASAAGCGQYYYATDAYQLNEIYIRLRHESIGQIVGEFGGQVRQGETTPPQAMPVPPGQDMLGVTLMWRGSALDLILTDPQGRRVTERYPGATLATYARFVYLIIRNPPAGSWKLSVFGRDVPEGIMDYHAVASVRQGLASPSSAFSIEQLVLPVAVIAVVALVLAIVALLRQRPTRSSRREVFPVPRVGVRIRQGHGPSGLISLRRGVLAIGRDPRNDLIPQDLKVSRFHAQIRREAGGYVIYDLNSTNGTYVNGQRVSRCVLQGGDEIRVGHTLLVFYEGS